tara:strand:+ start:31988 stop:32371 length:384 start_codon:yes stop_codon:yes gene_type:complete
MLFKDFYTIESITRIDDASIHVFIKLNKDHDVFNGHFPNNPVTPGVCMIQILKEITQTEVNKSLLIKNISNVKFTALINPFINPTLLLEINIIKENNIFKVKNISKFMDGTIALKCNATLSVNEELI